MRRNFSKNPILKKAFWRLSKGMNIFGKHIVATRLSNETNSNVFFYGHFGRQRRRL
jgi:hypothetical protein